MCRSQDANFNTRVLWKKDQVSVEQNALMSPNPSGKLEDLVVVVVCVSSCLKLVNSLLKLIQAQLNL